VIVGKGKGSLYGAKATKGEESDNEINQRRGALPDALLGREEKWGGGVST